MQKAVMAGNLFMGSPYSVSIPNTTSKFHDHEARKMGN